MSLSHVVKQLYCIYSLAVVFCSPHDFPAAGCAAEGGELGEGNVLLLSVCLCCTDSRKRGVK